MSAQAPAKVLPFRVIAFRIPATQFEKIQRHLEFAGNLIGQDAPLDWEDRETACRQICDALCAKSERRRISKCKKGKARRENRKLPRSRNLPL